MKAECFANEQDVSRAEGAQKRSFLSGRTTLASKMGFGAWSKADVAYAESGNPADLTAQAPASAVERSGHPSNGHGPVRAGLTDRSAFLAHLRGMVSDGDHGGLLVVGIDDMEVLNETYGRSVGDEVIDLFVALVVGHCGGPGAVARLGGTTLGVLTHGAAGASPSLLGQKILTRLRMGPVPTSIGPVNISASIGLAFWTGESDGTGAEELLARAEAAFIQARRVGGDTAVSAPASDSTEQALKQTVEMASRIVSALSGDRFVLAYQPIVDCTSGQIERWECLARIKDGSGAPIPAASFIPVAEERGLIRRIDMRVLRHALDDLVNHPALALSVNISSSGISDWDWMESYLEVIEARGDLGGRLMVELTEHARIDDLNRAAEFVRRLRSAGCLVAIDDFGAGYTSFRHLQTLSIDSVKIDGSFIRDLSDRPADQVFARSLIGLAREIGLKTIAECVGRDDDAAILREMGADYLQGFLFGRPDIDPSWRQDNAA